MNITPGQIAEACTDLGPVASLYSTAIERRDEESAVITPGHVAEARRDLGRRLAALREAAGLTQFDLAARVNYSRSTIANVETGRQKIPRSFWQRCDRELGADGVLLAAHDDVEALERRYRYHMTTVWHWTGREAKALRSALRLSVRDFADQLGIGVRTVTKWEARGAGVSLRPVMQAVLDTALERASHGAKARFTLLAGGGAGHVNGSHVNGNGRAGPATALVCELEAVRGVLMSGAQQERECRYTLHLDFAADSPAAARVLAVALAEGLGILRAEVQTYSARLSAGGRWGDAESVFCMADGPEGAFCAYAAGHPGWHAEAGVDGLRWGDGDGDERR